jgi:hypothetical protein
VYYPRSTFLAVQLIVNKLTAYCPVVKTPVRHSDQRSLKSKQEMKR